MTAMKELVTLLAILCLATSARADPDTRAGREPGPGETVETRETAETRETGETGESAKPAAPSPNPKLSAREILDQVDDLYRGSSSRGKMSMKVVTSHWIRTLDLEFWSKGKDRSMVRILSPRKEKGTATLKSGNNIWNYLPKVKRTIKVPSSMMGGSWMGSHFTNDDLVKESRMADDYEFEIGRQAEQDGVPVIEVRCTPKAEAAVVWGRVDVVVRRADIMPLSIRYYDEDLDLARTMSFGEFKELGGRTLPTLMRIVPQDKPKESTEVRYQEIAFDLDLDDSFFSIRSLQR